MPRAHILVLTGPTASGKTAVSIELAKKLNAEIVSADSIQVYRGLDIGSAKPTMEERQGIPHHMIDVADVSDPSFSVAEYKRQAEICIGEIAARGRLPLAVGGTGLYISALTYPLQFTSVPGNPAVRKALQEEDAQNPGALYRRLQQADPVTAARLHPNDGKRIVRALEVYEVSGTPLSTHGADFQNAAGAEPPFDAALFGLTMDRARLYERINRRVDAMMQNGLPEETKALFDAGLSPALPALQGLGYKQLLRHFRGETTLCEAVEEIKRETRRLSKRQLTWFKRDTRIRWLDSGCVDAEALAKRIYEAYLQDKG